MAGARQAVEEYQTATLNCLAEFGVTGSTPPGGAVTVRSTGPLSEAQEQLIVTALETCGDRVPEPTHWATLDALTQDDYERMLEARECLVVHGFEVEQPPSFEVWREQTPPWNPHSVFETSDLPIEVIEGIMQQCPQSGLGGITVISG